MPRSSALAAAAERRGVLLASGSRFAVDGALERFTRLPFTQPPDVLDHAVKLLGSAWSEVLQGRDGRSICGLVA